MQLRRIFQKTAYNLIYSQGEKLAEQLATEVLMNKHSDCNKTDFVLSNRNGGRGLRVHLGKIPELPQYSHENALKLRNQLNCSDNHFKKIMKANRVVYGRKSVEPGLRDVMEQTNGRFSNYFGYETVMVENSETNPETKVKTIFYEQKPLIFCHNIDEFVNEIFHARNLWSTMYQYY